MAMYATGEFAGYQYNGTINAWDLKRYSFTNISYPVPSDFTGKTSIATHTILDSNIKISLNLADNYSAIATTWVEFDKDTTLTCQVETDDGGSASLNGEVLMTGSAYGTQKSVTFNFKKGWNKVEICYREGTGGDGFVTTTKFSAVAKNMYSEKPTPVTLTNVELGKVYDWDGTVSHQLGKGYDYDGTTSHLIYSAEEVIVQADGTSNVNAILKAWNGSSWTTVNYTPNDGTKITSGTNGNITVGASKDDGAGPFILYMNNSTVGYNGAQIYLDTRSIDFSGFSTLKFNFNSTNTRGNAPTVAITNSIYTGNPQYYSGQATSMSVALNTTNKTYTLDVSGVTGTGFYICMRVLASAEGSQNGCHMYFKNFILE